MFPGFLMTQTSHGIREGPKADRPEEEKEKETEKEGANAKEEEDSSDQEREKAQENKEGKAALTW